jgi:hypothetical protein
MTKSHVFDPHLNWPDTMSILKRKLPFQTAARVAGIALACSVWALPCFADNSVLIGKMTGEQCRARGGVPVEVVPTAGEPSDPVRACFVDPSQMQNQGIQPAWLCPDGKTPIAATGGCPG